MTSALILVGLILNPDSVCFDWILAEFSDQRIQLGKNLKLQVKRIYMKKNIGLIDQDCTNRCDIACNRIRRSDIGKFNR